MCKIKQKLLDAFAASCVPHLVFLKILLNSAVLRNGAVIQSTK